MSTNFNSREHERIIVVSNIVLLIVIIILIGFEKTLVVSVMIVIENICRCIFRYRDRVSSSFLELKLHESVRRYLRLYGSFQIKSRR